MKIKQTLFFFLELAQIVIIALVIVLPIRYFVFQPFIVKGASMEPSFSNGDYLIIDELSYRFREPERGEVIVFKYPKEPSQRFIKRIIGLPEEKIIMQDNRITVVDKNGNQTVLDETTYIFDPLWSSSYNIELGKDEYFVMGDNRPHSFDSRKWGALSGDEIIGRVVLRAWPPTAVAVMTSAPSY